MEKAKGAWTGGRVNGKGNEGDGKDDCLNAVNGGVNVCVNGDVGVNARDVLSSDVVVSVCDSDALVAVSVSDGGCGCR